MKTLIPLQGGMKIKGCARVGKWKIYKGTALMRAAVYGYTEIVELLVEKEKGLRDSKGWTALMWAVKNDHTDCVRLLMREKDLKGYNGGTALDMAKLWRRHEIVALLSE